MKSSPVSAYSPAGPGETAGVVLRRESMASLASLCLDRIVTEVSRGAVIPPVGLVEPFFDIRLPRLLTVPK